MRNAARWGMLLPFLLGGCRAQAPGPTPTPVPGNGAQVMPLSADATALETPEVVTAPRTLPATAVRPAPDSIDDVVRTAVGVFGDSRAEVPVDSAAPEEPAWDIDVRTFETHDRVEYYVALFTDRARVRFVERLSRGTRYDAMIRAKLRAGGLPEDLTFLALVESGYDPHAYSRAAAVGMWQFMSSTARALGMRVDWWMDERRDPARSTDGAVRYLVELQRQFGSLYLATAAYNGGPGRIARGLSRFAEELDGQDGEQRFFALAEQNYLRAETRNYVPQIIAAALVGKFPQRYGLVVDSQPAYAYDSVAVAPGSALATVAMVAGLAPDSLRLLNPALLRGITPPDSRSWVRVPSGTGAATQAALDTVPTELLRGYTTVRSPERTVTPGTLASRHELSVRQLRWFNPGLRTSRSGRLVAGQSIRIPNRDALRLAFDLPDPSIERYASAAGGSTRSHTVHVVRRGETIGVIARRYGLTEARLKALNGLRGSRILAGQTLVIRSSVSARRSAKTKASTTKGTTKKAATTKGTKTSSAKTSSAKTSPSVKVAPKKPAVKKATTKGSTGTPTAKKSAAKRSPVKKATAKKPTVKKGGPKPSTIGKPPAGNATGR